MEKRLETAEQLLEILLHFLLLFCLETVAAAVFDAMDTPVGYLCLPVILPLLFWVFRRKIKHFSVFLLAHLGAGAGLFYIAARFYPYRLLWMTVFGAVAAVYAIHSMRARIRSALSAVPAEEEVHIVLAAAVAAGCFFACSYVGQEAGCRRILQVVLVYIPLWFLQSYLFQLRNYLRMNRSGNGVMPEKSMFRAGITAAGIGSLLAVVLPALLFQEALTDRLSQALHWIGMILLQGLVFLLSLFMDKDSRTVVPQTQAETAQAAEQLFMGAKEAPMWLQIVEKVFNLLVTAGLLVLAGWLLLRLIRFLISSFYANTKTRQVIRQEGVLEEEERLEAGTKRSPVRRHFWDAAPAWRVRRSFRKAVLAAQAGAVQFDRVQSDTARELAARLGAEHPAEWQELIRLYEKARYSPEDITRKQAGRAAALARQICR